MAVRLTINWRFLILSITALSAVLGALFFWQGRQVRKQSGVFLREADLARDRKETTREAAYLERYLRTKPNDLEVRERLARLYALPARTAGTPKQIENALFLLKDLLRRDQERDDLRRFTLEFVMDPRTSLILEAEEHLIELEAKFPDDADIKERYGTYHVANRDFKKAKEKFEKAYTLQPDRLTAYAGHAMVLRDRDRSPEEADKVIDKMLVNNATNFRAYLFAMDYGRRYGLADYVKKGIDTAIRLAPNERDVILARSDWLRDQARQARINDPAKAKMLLDEAKAILQAAILQANDPLVKTDLAFPLALAAVAAEVDSPEAAVKVLRDATKHFSENEKRLKLLTTLVEYQFQAADRLGVQETLDALKNLDVTEDRLAFHQARLSMAIGNWAKASGELQAILKEHPDDPAFVRTVNFLLGRCYEQIGETDRRFDAFSRSIPTDITDPLWIEGQQGLANTYAAIGRADEALRIYLKMTDQAPLAWLSVARLQILLAHRSSNPPNTKWIAADEAISRCLAIADGLTDQKRKAEVKTEIDLIRADLLTLQNRKDEALAIVDRLFSEQPDNPAIRISKAFLNSDVMGGIAFLEKARKELDDSVQLRLAQSQLLAGSKLDTVERALSALGEGCDRFDAFGQRRLFYGLAEAATVAGLPDLAGQFWDRVVKIQPDDYYVHLIRFDRAWQAKDGGEAMKLIRAEIARIDDGKESVASRLIEAFQLIRDGQNPVDEALLNRAINILDRLERERPNLTRVSIGKALIYDALAANADKSSIKDRAKILKYSTARLNYYRKAFNQGDTQPLILRRLTELLNSENLSDEANAILSRLVQNEQLTDATSLRLAADVSLRSNNPVKAIEYASRAVTPHSKNPADLIWKGRLLLMANSDRSGAQDAFRRAAHLKPEDPEAWLLLIEIAMSENLVRDAIGIMTEAEKKVRPKDRSLFVARAYKLTKQKQLATDAFRKAGQEHPDDPDVLRAEADFLMAEKDWEAALEAWNRVIRLEGIPEDERSFARNMLAICLAFNPDYLRAREDIAALGLDKNGLPLKESNLSPRTRAIILSLQRDQKSKREAIKLFEQERGTLPDNDIFLLAQWYIQVNDVDFAKHTLTDLVSRPPSNRNPLYLSFLVGWLLDQHKPTDAKKWVDELEKIEPNAPRTIGLKIRTLAGNGNTDEARKLLKDHSEKQNANLNDLALVAEQAGLDADAEDLFKRYVKDQQGKEPDVELQLAGFYARHGRLVEALTICESTLNTTNRPEAVGEKCIEALSSTPKVDPSRVVQVVGWLEAAQAKHPQSASALQHQLAYVKNLQEKYDDAIRLYERQCASPDVTPTDLNNLAYLLSSHRRKYDDALELIARAKKIQPQNSELLDTEALILLARGTPEDLNNARERLMEAVNFVQNPKGSYYFHLALVEAKLRKREASTQAWREAERLKLKASDLHPLEWPAFYDMAKINN